MNSFHNITAYAFLLVILINSIFWILNGYQDAWGAFIAAVCLSELFHDFAHSGKSIKVHSVFSKVHKFIRKTSKISYHVLIGRAGIWSVLYWADPPDLKYLIFLYVFRKLTRYTCSRKMNVAITPTKIVLAIIFVPMIVTITIAPRIIREFIMMGRMIIVYVKAQEIPWKNLIENKLKETLQQGAEFELSINRTSLMFCYDNTVKAYHASGILDAIKASKDDIQAVVAMIRSSESLQKTISKYSVVTLQWFGTYIQVIRQLLIFLTTLLTFLNYKQSLLWYIGAALEPIDQTNRVERTIKRTLQSIIYGGLIKLATNFWLLFFLGSTLKVPFYALSALSCSLLSLVSQPLYHFGLILISIYSIHTTSIVKILLASMAFLHLKRGVRSWAHERNYRFPMTNVLLGYLKFGLAGVFLWPISMSLLNEVYSILFLQSQ